MRRLREIIPQVRKATAAFLATAVATLTAIVTANAVPEPWNTRAIATLATITPIATFFLVYKIPNVIQSPLIDAWNEGATDMGIAATDEGGGGTGEIGGNRAAIERAFYTRDVQ